MPHDPDLAWATGQPLPPSRSCRLLTPVPHVDRADCATEAAAGEALKIKVIVLDNKPAKPAALYWRPLGKEPFQRIEVKHLARAVYQATLPPATEDFEYYIQAQTEDGKDLAWPATRRA